MKIRINADDFGISKGVNSAIEEMFKCQKLHSASLIYGCGYFEQALEISKRNPNLKVGLHFNLCSGKSAFNHGADAILTDENGRFKNGFLKLLLLSLFKKQQFTKEVAQELEAQILALKNNGIKVNHIDSHRHTHFIPAIFSLVVASAKNHKIEKIRVINESLLETFKINYPKSFLFNGGVVKWLILRFLGLINNSKKIPQSYFFSILYTCSISRDLIAKIKVPKKYDEVEIMIHPGNPLLDDGLQNLEERPHLMSQKRYVENL